MTKGFFADRAVSLDSRKRNVGSGSGFEGSVLVCFLCVLGGRGGSFHGKEETFRVRAI